VQFQLTPVSLDQFGEGIRVAGLRPAHKISFDGNSSHPGRGDPTCRATGIDAAPARNRASSCPLSRLPDIYLFDRWREAGRRSEETTVPKFQTRLGGYSVVTAEDIDGAAALATGCPALQFGGGVEIGAVPEFTGNPQAGTDA